LLDAVSWFCNSGACSINVVSYYAASIYEMAGFSQIVSIWLSAFTSLAQIFGLALSVLLVEKASRHLLILSSLGLVSCWLRWLHLGTHLPCLSRLRFS
jgi:hypothetical protein